MKIGFIGTGIMGSPMALHLAKHHVVTVYNRTLHKAQRLLPYVQVAELLDDRIFRNDVILTMVGTPKDVQDIYTLLIEHCEPKTILIDLTTSSPQLALTIYQQALTKRIACLDAPVTGGENGAKNQTLAIMVGGDQPIYESMVPLLKLFGTHIFYMGGSGQGQHAKMANQIAIAGSLASLAEALVYAEKQNLALDQVLHYLSLGAASSYSVSQYGPKMMAHDWQATFQLKHYLKDLTIALSVYPDLPVARTVKTLLERLVVKYGHQGVQAIIQAYNQPE